MSKVLEVKLTDTLMRFDSYLEAYVQSGDRFSTYYFRVPDIWAEINPDLRKASTFQVMKHIYDDFAEHFRQVEPDDINYLAPLDVAPRVLTAEEEAAKPWLTAGSPSVWEWTPCVVVDEGNRHRKVAPEEF